MHTGTTHARAVPIQPDHLAKKPVGCLDLLCDFTPIVHHDATSIFNVLVRLSEQASTVCAWVAIAFILI